MSDWRFQILNSSASSISYLTVWHQADQFSTQTLLLWSCNTCRMQLSIELLKYLRPSLKPSSRCCSKICTNLDMYELYISSKAPQYHQKCRGLNWELIAGFTPSKNNFQFQIVWSLFSTLSESILNELWFRGDSSSLGSCPHMASSLLFGKCSSI